MKRESMVFRRYLHEAIRRLPGDMYKEVLEAVFDYALDGEMPVGLSGTAEMAFLLIRPHLDAELEGTDGNAKQKGGRHGN